MDYVRSGCLLYMFRSQLGTAVRLLDDDDDDDDTADDYFTHATRLEPVTMGGTVVGLPMGQCCLCNLKHPPPPKKLSINDCFV